MTEPNDVESLFRERDDIGDGTSLWLRPLRLFFSLGKPPGEFTVLAFRLPTGSFPFAVLTRTKRARIVFWPILPKNATHAIHDSGTIPNFDHITLEFPSERIHATAFTPKGKRRHFDATCIRDQRAWRLCEYRGSGLARFLTMIVKLRVVREQEVIVQRRVAMPNTDADRRTKAFIEFANKMRVIHVNLPPHDSSCDYVYCTMFYDRDPTALQPVLTQEMFQPIDADSHIDDWPDGNTFGIQPTLISVDSETRFLVATSCPPGIAKSDVVIGFPSPMFTK